MCCATDQCFHQTLLFMYICMCIVTIRQRDAAMDLGDCTVLSDCLLFLGTYPITGVGQASPAPQVISECSWRFASFGKRAACLVLNSVSPPFLVPFRDRQTHTTPFFVRSRQRSRLVSLSIAREYGQTVLSWLTFALGHRQESNKLTSHPPERTNDLQPTAAHFRRTPTVY